MFLRPEQKIIVAADVATEAALIQLVEELGHTGVMFKVGFELITSIGVPRAVEIIKGFGGKVFLDIKFKDIEKTIEAATQAVVFLGIDMVNIHASLPTHTLETFADVCSENNIIGLGVTVLTDHTEEDCKEIYGFEISQTISKLSNRIMDAGLSGIICSPNDVAILLQDQNIKQQKKEAGLVFVTPGVRPAWADPSGQTRFTTPGEAILAGSDYLVIGSPIRDAKTYGKTPLEALESIIEEVSTAMLERLFVDRGAILDGHFVYTSQKHGSKYINKDILYQNPIELSWICEQMAKKVQHLEPQIIIGAAVAGIPVAQYTGLHLNEKASVVYAEKDNGGLILKRGYDTLIKGKRVVIVEDIINTGKTIRQLVDVVRKHGGEVVAVISMCNRCGNTAKDFDVPNLYSLYSVDFSNFEPDSCELCNAGVPVNTNAGHGRSYLLKDRAA